MKNPSILKRLYEQFSTRVGQIEQRNKISKLNLIFLLCSTLESWNYEWNDELSIEPTRSLQISHRCRHTVKSEFALAWNRHFFHFFPPLHWLQQEHAFEKTLKYLFLWKIRASAGFEFRDINQKRSICDWGETINYWAIIEMRLSGRRNALKPSRSGDDLQKDF